MRDLKLTLKWQPFELMASGEKMEEYREVKPWVDSRLLFEDNTPRVYDRIIYTNGYGKDRPRLTVDFSGIVLLTGGVHHEYSNGLIVSTTEPRWKILHTRIIRIENFTLEGNL